MNSSLSLSMRILPVRPKKVCCFQEAATRLLEGTLPISALADARRRLNALFLNTLASLPLPVQRALEGFWRKERGIFKRFPSELSVPRLRVLPVGSDEMLSSALAQTDGFSFEFLLPLVANAPDSVLRAVIAHEVGHAYLRASNFEATDEDAEEAAARITSRAWGFNEDDIDTWADDSGSILQAS